MKLTITGHALCYVYILQVLLADVKTKDDVKLAVPIKQDQIFAGAVSYFFHTNIWWGLDCSVKD